jgi:CcmD family protein
MIESNPAFIVAAYAVTWIVLIGYSLQLGRKDRKVYSGYESMVYRNRGENGQ